MVCNRTNRARRTEGGRIATRPAVWPFTGDMPPVSVYERVIRLLDQAEAMTGGV